MPTYRLSIRGVAQNYGKINYFLRVLTVTVEIPFI